MDTLKWGVELTSLRKIENPLGNVMHGIKQSESSYCGFGEAYFSCVQPGSRKGWKKHNKMTLNLIVPIGAIRVFIFSARLSGEINLDEGPLEYLIGAENYCRLTIPPKLWVGFQGEGIEESMLLNVASHEHDPQEFDTMGIESVNFNWHSN
jgi:dTDP-4-dehydrorhamnose 3,5-epimerase